MLLGNEMSIGQSLFDSFANGYVHQLSCSIENVHAQIAVPSPLNVKTV